MNGDDQVGLISISKGNNVLLGMEFLRKFKKKLNLDCESNIVRLD